MATILGSLLVNLGLETGEFKSGLSAAEKDLRRSTKRIENIGKSMTNLGQKMSIAVTAPIVALGVASVKAAMESQDAIAQVNSALKSMGDGAGRTAEQLEGLSSGIMRKSLYDDDEILRKVTANLLTFGNVAGEQFDRAQQAAVDLAARMGTDLQSATLMIGKALNDPAKGLAALRRVGIQFTEQQQDQIKAMDAAGDAAGAQTIMLKELERQFGGSAKAAREANPLAAMQMSWAEFQETIGEKLLPLLPRITDAITSVLDAFGKLSPGMQTAAIAVAGLAAVFGPLLIGLGAIVTATAPFTAAIAALFSSGGLLVAAKGVVIGLTAAFGPWLAVIGAVAAAGYLIYQNWDKIAPVLQDLWDTIQSTLGPPLQRLIAAVKEAFSALWNGPLGPIIQKVIGVLATLSAAFLSAFGQTVIIAIKGLAVAIGVSFDAIGLAIRAVVALFDGSFKTAIVNAVRYIYLQVKAWLLDKLAAVWDGVKNKINEVKGYFYNLYDAVVGHSYIPDMVDGIAAQMLRLDSVMVDKAKSSTAKTKAAFEKLRDDLAPLLERLFPEAAALNQYRAESALIDRGAAAGALTSEQAAEARRRLALEGSSSTIGDRIGGDDPLAIMDFEQVQIGLSKISGLHGLWAQKAETVNVRVAKSFKDMADETISALNSLATSIKGGGFLDILGSVIGLGLQLGSLGAFGKRIQTNINTVPDTIGSLPRSARVGPSSKSGSSIQIAPSPYFDVVVDGRIQQAAPSIAGAGSTGAQVAMAVKSSRRFP